MRYIMINDDCVYTYSLFGMKTGIAITRYGFTNDGSELIRFMDASKRKVGYGLRRIDGTVESLSAYMADKVMEEIVDSKRTKTRIVERIEGWERLGNIRAPEQAPIVTQITQVSREVYTVAMMRMAFVTTLFVAAREYMKWWYWSKRKRVILPVHQTDSS